MSWARERRLDYIDWCLSARGEVQRADLMRLFGVSESWASADINAFVAAYPAAVSYDPSRKRYVPTHRPFRRQRKGAWVTAIDWPTVAGPLPPRAAVPRSVE